MQVALLAQLAGVAFAQSAPEKRATVAGEYVVGSQDALSITVLGRQELAGTYTVQADGTLEFPLIGRVTAAGLTIQALTNVVHDRLADGYFTNPQVSITVQAYRSQKVFIIGEVRTPGTYPLTGDMTLIEALARAGSVSVNAGNDIVVVHALADREAHAPSVPDDADVLHVDLSKLQQGDAAENVRLRDGDTIFVSKAETVFVFGQVKNPGSYSIQNGTTVLQALSLAGGTTQRAATGRIRVVRFVNGEKQEVKLQLSDLVKSGDTLIVPERFF